MVTTMATSAAATAASAGSAGAPAEAGTTAGAENAGSGIVRRNNPGTKAADFCRWQDENFDEMDSTLAVQQFIQQTIRKDVADVDLILQVRNGNVSLLVSRF